MIPFFYTFLISTEKLSGKPLIKARVIDLMDLQMIYNCPIAGSQLQEVLI